MCRQQVQRDLVLVMMTNRQLLYFIIRKYDTARNLRGLSVIGYSRPLFLLEPDEKNGITSYGSIENDYEPIHGLLKVEGALVDCNTASILASDKRPSIPLDHNISFSLSSSAIPI